MKQIFRGTYFTDFTWKGVDGAMFRQLKAQPRYLSGQGCSSQPLSSPGRICWWTLSTWASISSRRKMALQQKVRMASGLTWRRWMCSWLRLRYTGLCSHPKLSGGRGGGTGTELFTLNGYYHKIQIFFNFHHQSIPLTHPCLSLVAMGPFLSSVRAR